MSIEQNSVVDDTRIKNPCKICGGKGTIQIYRSDLEEHVYCRKDYYEINIYRIQ